jgi:dynein light chain LC8-type
MAEKKSDEKLEAQVKAVDMSEDMQQEAIEVAQDAMTQYNIEKVREEKEGYRIKILTGA